MSITNPSNAASLASQDKQIEVTKLSSQGQDDAKSVAPGSPGQKVRNARTLTIGAVYKTLSQEFPDISISKIRYLENQKLLSPHRTPGGYRLYSSSDVTRLRAILRLQRDEFLPLRVIRQELASGRRDVEAPIVVKDTRQTHSRIRPQAIKGQGGLHSLTSVLSDTGATAELINELIEFGIVSGVQRSGERYFDDLERAAIRAGAELARYGVAGRNLRVLRSSAEREAALLQQILAPALHSRNPDRRKEALEALESLTTIASDLKHLMVVRELRGLLK